MTILLLVAFTLFVTCFRTRGGGWRESFLCGAQAWGVVTAALERNAGSDRFANVVQWFSMTASIVGVTLLARMVGATMTGQVLAAVLVALCRRASCRPPGRKTITTSTT